MVRHSMVWTLPSEVSKSLPGFIKGFTRALGKLTDGFLNGGNFPYGIVFSLKISSISVQLVNSFPNFKDQSLAQSLRVVRKSFIFIVSAGTF